MRKCISAIFLFVSLGSFAFADDPWRVVEIVDEFNDPTGKYRVFAVVRGTFADSATNGSALTVYAFVDIKEKGPDLCFELSKYGRSVATVYYDTVKYIVKDGSGNKHEWYWYSPQYNARYWYAINNSGEGADTDVMLPIFKNGGMVQIIIRGGGSIYNFSIDCTNFSTHLAEAMKAQGVE